MFGRCRVPHWTAIEYTCLLLLLWTRIVPRGFAFKTGTMRIPVARQQCWKATRAAVLLPRCWLSSSSIDDNNYSTTTSSRIVGKTNGYSKLPRIYVGSIPSDPAICQNFEDIRQILSIKNSPIKCREKASFELTAEQSRYLTTVLRWNNKRKSDSRLIRVFDQHSEWLAVVSILEDKRRNPVVTVECTKQIRTSGPPCAKQSLLCIAPPKKKERLRWLIEKTVELGVDGFIFLDTEHAEAVCIDFDKVQSYAIEAVEQSERLSLPIFVSAGEEIRANSENQLSQQRGPGSGLKPYGLQQFLRNWTDNSVGIILIARERFGTVPILQALQNLPQPEQTDDPVLVMFLVGPEGGWSLAEEEMMNSLENNHRSSVSNVSLGNTVLRSETAAMTAIAAYSLVNKPGSCQ